MGISPGEPPSLSRITGPDYDGPTTPDGAKTLNDYKFGDIRFNKPNRTHKEEVVRGHQRAILTELK